MSGYRLASGGLIDRKTSLSFTFDSKTFTGHQGDTLASALIANGASLVGRSFKYHRPRGIVTAGSAEPNALVELREGARKEPNTRATMVELYDGLIARSQNRWPSLAFDIGAINQLAAPIFAAGFYYKTFMWPSAFWEKVYEPIIRRAAGLGRASYERDPDRYEKAHAHCDVLVIGSGPSGLMAALTAARAGARVVLVDEGTMFGGSLLSENDEIDGQSGRDWAAGVVSELAQMPDVRFLIRTTVFGWYDDNVFGAIERTSDHVAAPASHTPRQRYWKIHAKRAVLCAGAEERPIVFGGNDRPGVMQASAMRAYVNRYAASPGRSVVVFTCNDSGYRTVHDLRAAGVDVAAVVDSRADAPEIDTVGVAVFKGAVVTDVIGSKSILAAEISYKGGRQRVPCDAVAMSGGWSPTLHLTCHRGEKPVWNDMIAAFVAPDVGQGFVAAGAAAGIMTLGACLEDGANKGAKAASDTGFDRIGWEVPRTSQETYQITPLWHVKGARTKAFLDFQNDVTVKDVPLAAREGFVDVELAKRYTTLGMATDQGKLSNVNGAAILAEAVGKSMAQVGTTTFRPFYTPVAFGALAGPFVGQHLQPVRKTPLHDWCVEQGAVFVEAGMWLRSSWFPRPGEKDWLQTVSREVMATRSRVGLCDVSTLGKIDVQGPDAAELLNRLYCNGWSTLAVGKARYGLMLREDGFLFDDGTTSRLAANHFFMTTTTTNAANVLAHIEFCHQTLWPDLDVQYTSVTDQWAQIAVAGPKARATLQKIVDGVELNDETFPYLAAKHVSVLGDISARLFRISFSGEHAYELSVPADFGDAVVRVLMEAGREFDITPYGVEALSVMRIEKGHVAGGELSGTTTPSDLGLGRMMSTKKDYIGRMMAQREGLVAPDREALVGIRPLNKADRFRAGAHLLNRGDKPSLENDQGYITSVALSPMLDMWVGLALLKRGRERHGEIVQVYDALAGQGMVAEICDPVHYDRENKSLHA